MIIDLGAVSAVARNEPASASRDASSAKRYEPSNHSPGPIRQVLSTRPVMPLNLSKGVSDT